MGGKAQDGWRRFGDRHPDVAELYTVIATLITSPLGITNGGKHSTAEGIAQVRDALSRAADVLEGGGRGAENPERDDR